MTQPPPEAGYEVTDANGRDLAITLAVFAACAAFAIAGTGLALHLFGGSPARYGTFTNEQRTVIAPPEPRLQADPAADLARFKSWEEAGAVGYGTLRPGLAHIPISRAMALLEGSSLDPAPLVKR